MIHTLQFYCSTTIDDIRASENKHTTDFSSVIKTVHTNYPSITITQRRSHSKNKYTFFFFVDAIKLLSKSDITEADYDSLNDALNVVVDFLFPSSSLELNLIRVDYRFDVVITDESIRHFLFKLYEKNIEYYRYQKRANGKKKTPTACGEKYKTSLYYNSKSIVTIVYDKPSERLAKAEPIQNYEKDVLRFEVHLLNKHLNYRKKEHGITKNLYNYMQKDTYLRYMHLYVLKIFQVGNFYTIREARKIIRSSTLKERDQKELEDFLIKVSKKGIEALLAYHSHKKVQGEYSRYKIKKYLTFLESLNINPILIPVNAKMPSFIPNPLNGLPLPPK